MLLQSDATPAEVAMTLGMKYEAATKAIQRVRARVALCLQAAKPESRTTIDERKDLAKEWT